MSTEHTGHDDPPSHEAVNLYIDAAADDIELSGEMRVALREPAREIAVQIPVRLDNGAVRMVRGFRLMRSLLSQPALARYGAREFASSAGAQTDEQIVQFIRDYGDTIYHPVGSCRMGPGPLDVVDERLRVRGIERLRVVDASIMPRVVGGNTNAPTIMIAEKASDMIREDAAAA